MRSRQSLQNQATIEDNMATRLVVLAREAEERGNEFLAQSYEELAQVYRDKALGLREKVTKTMEKGALDLTRSR